MLTESKKPRIDFSEKITASSRTPTLSTKSKMPFIRTNGFNLEENNTNDVYNRENFWNFQEGINNKIITKGKYGEIFLSRNKINNKIFIVKKLNKSFFDEMKIPLDIIKNEINIQSKLNHENILKLYSKIETDEELILILQNTNRGSLANLIKKECLDEKSAFKIFIQILLGLNYLHENKVLHRDLKPDNILLDTTNNAFISDFRRSIEISFGNVDSFCGTYEYMAPEIVNEIPYNFSVDIWSVGVILYEMLHGFTPFKSETNDEQEIFENILESEIKLKSGLSLEVKDLISKMLERDSSSRIKLKEIFQHQWILSHSQESTLMKLKTYDSLSTTDSGNELKSQSMKKKSFNVLNNLKISIDENENEGKSTLLSSVLNKITKSTKNKFSTTKSLRRNFVEFGAPNENDNKNIRSRNLKLESSKTIFFKKTENNEEFDSPFQIVKSENNLGSLYKIQIPNSSKPEKIKDNIIDSISVLDKVQTHMNKIENEKPKEGFLKELFNLFAFKCTK